MTVDAGEVDRRSPGRPVELGGTGRAVFRPGRVVPAGAEHCGRGMLLDVVGELVQRGRQGSRRGQVETAQGKSRRGHVHVGVHERWGDQGVVELHDLLDGLVEVHRLGSRGRADPGNRVVVDQHRGRERRGRAVHTATAIEDAAATSASGTAACGRTI